MDEATATPLTEDSLMQNDQEEEEEDEEEKPKEETVAPVTARRPPQPPGPFDANANDTPDEAFRKEVMRIRYRIQKQFLKGHSSESTNHLELTHTRLQRLATMEIPLDLVRTSKVMKVLRMTLEEHKNSNSTVFPLEIKTLCTDIYQKLATAQQQEKQRRPSE